MVAALFTACASDDSSTDAGGATTTIAPLPSGPPPYETGPFEAGRRTITVTDPAREGRELTVDCRYPADETARRVGAEVGHTVDPRRRVHLGRGRG